MVYVNSSDNVRIPILIESSSKARILCTEVYQSGSLVSNGWIYTPHKMMNGACSYFFANLSSPKSVTIDENMNPTSNNGLMYYGGGNESPSSHESSVRGLSKKMYNESTSTNVWTTCMTSNMSSNENWRACGVGINFNQYVRKSEQYQQCKLQNGNTSHIAKTRTSVFPNGCLFLNTLLVGFPKDWNTSSNGGVGTNAYAFGGEYHRTGADEDLGQLVVNPYYPTSFGKTIKISKVNQDTINQDLFVFHTEVSESASILSRIESTSAEETFGNIAMFFPPLKTGSSITDKKVKTGTIKIYDAFMGVMSL